MIAVYLAEDEPLARAALAGLLRDVPGWTLIGDADNGEQALRDCLHNPPDVLFTDIQMPMLGGLELAAALRRDRPGVHVVFITAHDQHAVQAFRLAAVDYLLKPLATSDFRACIDRVEQRVRERRSLPVPDGSPSPLDALLAAHRQPLRSLIVRSIGRMDVIPVREVIAFRATGNYVEVITAGRTLLHRQTIKSLIESLDPHAFVQTHRTTIVSIKHIRAIEKRDGSTFVALPDGLQLPVSPRHQPAVERCLGMA